MTEKPKDYRAGHRARLKQRFLKSGGKGVGEHELLELILFRSLPRRDVKQLAHLLLDKFGDLSAVMGAPPEELLRVKGVGEQVVFDFKIVEEAALRFGQARVMNRDLFLGWRDLVAHHRAKLAEKRKEEFHVVFIDKQNRIMGEEKLSDGTIDHTPVYTREVFERALTVGASMIVLLHNHPAGDAKPSNADIAMTKKLRSIGESMGVIVHDHIIIGRKGEYSFKDGGVI